MYTTPRVALMAGILVCIGAMGCGSAPRTMDYETFRQRTLEHEQFTMEQRETFARRFVLRMERIHQENLAAGADPEVVIDVLLLSSGGQFGAFGVGVLEGWGTIESGTYQRPVFDIVTGVSTGALIAPFALSGTDYSIARIADLYKQADDTLAVLRGLLFFLPSRVSFFDNRSLIERIEQEIDRDTIAEVAKAHNDHRMLLIGATDLDLGRFHIWDMGVIATCAVETGDPSRFQRAMLSSASIPAAFPPVEIDGVLYADGAAAVATFFGMDRTAIRQAVAAFLVRNPGAPTPRFRMWMIINGQLDASPQLIEKRWVSIASRSVAVLTKYSTRTTLRQMQLAAELLGGEIGVPVEFRYLALPDDAELPESRSRLFDQDLMAKVHSIGHALGSDPSSWRTEAIAPDIPGSGFLLPEIRFDWNDLARP